MQVSANRLMNRYLVLLLAGALLIRVALLIAYPAIPMVQWLAEGTDAIGYMQLSENLLETGSFQFDRGSATAYRMPGYPLFLLLTYAPWQILQPAQLLQIVLDVLTVYMTYRIARRLTTGMAGPLLAAAVVSFHPLMIVTSLTLRPEALSIFLVTLASWLLLRPLALRAGIMAAVLLTTAVYLKHMLIAVAGILLVGFAIRIMLTARGKGARLVGWLPLLVIGLALAPWVARNYAVLDAFVPLTTSSGSNLYGGNNPAADGGYVSSEPYVLPGVAEVESDQILTERAVSWIRSNPGMFVGLLPLKAARLFWPLSLGTSRSIEVPTPVFWGVLAVTVAFYSFVFYGSWRLFVTRQYWELFVLATVPVMLVLFTLLTFGAARFLLPAFPAFAVLVAVAAEAVLVRSTRNAVQVDPSCQEVSPV